MSNVQVEREQTHRPHSKPSIVTDAVACTVEKGVRGVLTGVLTGVIGLGARLLETVHGVVTLDGHGFHSFPTFQPSTLPPSNLLSACAAFAVKVIRILNNGVTQLIMPALN